MKQQKHKILEYKLDLSQIENPQLKHCVLNRLESGFLFGWNEENDYHHSKEEDDKWTDYYVHTTKHYPGKRKSGDWHCGEGSAWGIDPKDYKESS